MEIPLIWRISSLALYLWLFFFSQTIITFVRDLKNWTLDKISGIGSRTQGEMHHSRRKDKTGLVRPDAYTPTWLDELVTIGCAFSFLCTMGRENTSLWKLQVASTNESTGNSHWFGHHRRDDPPKESRANDAIKEDKTEWGCTQEHWLFFFGEDLFPVTLLQFDISPTPFIIFQIPNLNKGVCTQSESLI